MIMIMIFTIMKHIDNYNNNNDSDIDNDDDKLQ